MIRTTVRILTVLTGAVALIAAPAAFAGDSAQEAATAAQHAGFAAKSPKIEQVHMHLHHAVNCLVGPDGRDFDANQANPCKGKGNGAIPDATDPATKQHLMDALAVAKAGLATSDMAASTQAASDLHALLSSSM